jgi:hypothetical protein
MTRPSPYLIPQRQTQPISHGQAAMTTTASATRRVTANHGVRLGVSRLRSSRPVSS